jgi:hypothetical protein
MSIQDIEAAFPAIVGTSYSEESPVTDIYNCIAFAFGDHENWWWPRQRYGNYWPPGFSVSDSVDVLMAIFEVHGYSECDNPEFEEGFEKVAIYSVDLRIKHAARQLRSGRWTSKLGDQEDIEHEKAEHLNSLTYGSATHFLKRHRADWEEDSTE